MAKVEAQLRKEVDANMQLELFDQYSKAHEAHQQRVRNITSSMNNALCFEAQAHAELAVLGQTDGLKHSKIVDNIIQKYESDLQQEKQSYIKLIREIKERFAYTVETAQLVR